MIMIVRIARALRRHAGRLFGSRACATAGVASVELAIVAPLIIVAIIGTVDLGFAIHRKMQVQAAARAGAEYAIVKGFSVSGISNAVVSATPMAGLRANPAPQQFCGCPSDTGIAALSCNATCPDQSKPGAYVTVSAQALRDDPAPTRVPGDLRALRHVHGAAAMIVRRFLKHGGGASAVSSASPRRSFSPRCSGHSSSA